MTTPDNPLTEHGCGKVCYRKVILQTYTTLCGLSGGEANTVATVPDRQTGTAWTARLGASEWRERLRDRSETAGLLVYALVLVGGGLAALSVAIGGAVALGGVAGAVAFLTGGLLCLAVVPTAARVAGRTVATRLEGGRDR